MFPEQRTLGRFRGLVARGGLDFPPILAIHGAFGHPAQFTPLMIAMAQRGFTFYALPLSGHVEGTSDAVRGPRNERLRPRRRRNAAALS